MSKKIPTNQGIVVRLVAIIIAVIIVVWLIAYFDAHKGAAIIPVEQQDTATTTVMMDTATTTSKGGSEIFAVASSTPKTVASTTPGKNFWTPMTGILIFPDDLTFKVTTDKKTYTQNEKIQITMTVTNSTDEAITLSFNTSCQSNYTISTMDAKKTVEFESNKNSVCAAYKDTLVVPAKSKKEIKSVHDPLVYRLTPGSHAITGNVIGYGESSIAVKITP